MTNYQFNMNLSQAILESLQELTNPDNEIRSQAEENFNNLILENPIDVINSLFEIIDNDPSTNEAYLCAILIRNYLNKKNLVDISVNSPDFFQHLKNNILKFASDSRFPQNLNMFLISELLITFYSLSEIQGSNSFPEFIPFLISLLESDDYKSNSLEAILYTDISDNLETYYPQIIEKCDVFNQDFEYRARSFCFYINSITYESFDFQNFFQSISQHLPQIFDDMPDKQLNECITMSFKIYTQSEKYKLISLFFPAFLFVILPRLSDPTRDELSKVNLIHHITTMLTSTFFFDFIPQNEIHIKLLEALAISSSEPNENRDLYNECDQCIKNLYIFFKNSNKSMIVNHPHRYNFFIALKEMENFPNLFVSSLFAKYFANDISDIERSIEYSTIEDDEEYSRALIRQNGLKQLKKIIKRFNHLLSDEKKMEIFDILMNLYATYEDEKIMEVMTLLAFYFSEEMVTFKRGDIIDLCQKKITAEIICCASYFCLIPDSEQAVELVGFLFQATIELMTHDICTLPNVIFCLSQVVKTAGIESTYKFVETIMPAILDDPKCFSHKKLRNIFDFIKDFENTSELAKAIFAKLMEFIENTDENDLMIQENLENLCFSIKRLPFYADFIPDFADDCLKGVIDVVEKRLNEFDDRIRGVTISTISKLSKFYCFNNDMLNEIIQKFLNLFQNETNIYIILSILSAFCRITSSLDQNSDINIDYLINSYPSMFESTYNCVQQVRQNDKILDYVLIIDMGNSIKKLLELFNDFLGRNPQMVSQLILNFFLRNELNDENGLYYNSPDFRSFFVNLWCSLLTIVDIEILSDDCPTIVQMLIDYIFNNPSTAIRDKMRAIISLTYFFDQNEMPNELISDFIWNGLIPLINENKSHIEANEEEEEETNNNNPFEFLIQDALSSLIVIATRYCNDEINFKSTIPVAVENIRFLSNVRNLTFLRLFELIKICLSDAETAPCAAPLLEKAIGLVQDEKTEYFAIKSIHTELSNKTEIPEEIEPFFQLISQVVRTVESQ